MAVSEHYIKLAKGEAHFEARGERDFVERALERWGTLLFAGQAIKEPSPVKEPDPIREPERMLAESVAAPRRISVRKNIDFPDFLKLKEPETTLDRLLTLAYYLEKYESRQNYDLSELNEVWHRQFPEDALTPGVWEEAIAKSYLLDSKGKLTLSFSGEAYVQNGLADRYR